MSLFKKDLEKKAFKEALNAEVVIETKAMTNELIWQSPIKKFNVKTKLIVKANSEAIFLKNGEMVAVYERGGEYEIGEELDKKDLLSCDVYFVNKTVRQQILWGTPTKIDFQDAETGIYVSLGASGTLSFAIKNVQKVFGRMVGLSDGVTANKVSDFFRSKIALFVKDALAKKLVTEKIGFYAISTNIKNLSIELKNEFASEFDEYGIEVCDFTIDNLVYPEEIKKLMQDKAKEKYILREEGTSHTELRKNEREDEDKKLHIIEEAVKGSGKADSSIFCQKCGAKLAENSKFCNICGANLSQKGKVCSGCGALVDDTAIFCNKCGRKL
ncbi:MAG: SPFH domain-containing protein [Clostridia bacterium]